MFGTRKLVCMESFLFLFGMQQLLAQLLESPPPPPPPPQKNDGEIHIYINRKYPVEDFLIANVHVWHMTRGDIQS
jgi:hypothetical protein